VTDACAACALHSQPPTSAAAQTCSACTGGRRCSTLRYSRAAGRQRCAGAASKLAVCPAVRPAPPARLQRGHQRCAQHPADPADPVAPAAPAAPAAPPAPPAPAAPAAGCAGGCAHHAARGAPRHQQVVGGRGRDARAHRQAVQGEVRPVCRVACAPVLSFGPCHALGGGGGRGMCCVRLPEGHAMHTSLLLLGVPTGGISLGGTTTSTPPSSAASGRSRRTRRS
jgi:hypothetical protein